uniref:Uncharacterized protein n=1 Tax=Cryptomonas curvata TaxID=233186 RepID=A0A7S0M4R5_9CRYP
MLVSDVLDTFCVQGRQRIESLHAAIESHNLPDAIFDAMFLLGTAKNLGAQSLIEAVEALLCLIRAIGKLDSLIDVALSFDAHCCCNHVDALVASICTIRGCFDQVDHDARRAVADLARCNVKAAAGYVEKNGGFDSSSSLPELDMIFTQALFQSRPS